VSNKILFLYLTKRQKSEFEKCEKILKTIFRKFRRSVIFSYLQADISPSCLQLFRRRLYEEMQNNDVCFISGDITYSEKDIIIRNILGEYTEAHFLKGCSICHPPSAFNVINDDEKVTLMHTAMREHFKKAVDVAITLSLERKRKLTVCTDSGMGSFIKDALSDGFDKSLHIKTEQLTFEEALLICMNSVPTFDVVLTSEHIASFLKMHIGYTGNLGALYFPDGFSIFYTEKGKVYTRQTFPFEQINNTPIHSTIISFSAILEKEFAMKSASEWLKRTATVAFETHHDAPTDSYVEKVISEIEKPMRKHYSEVRK